MKVNASIGSILMTAMKTVLVYFVFIFFFFGTPVVQSIWKEYGGIRAITTNYKTAVIATTPIKVEIVKEEKERIKGLSGRKNLGEKIGMLFVFPTSDFHGIWMKDMNFPIDIVWLDAGYFIVDYVENVSPDTYPETFRPNKKAIFVLELNSGFIKENFIKVGDQLTLF